MQVFIKALNGRTITLDIEGDITVGELKQRIQAKEGIPTADQRIIICGKAIDDSARLESDLQIQKLEAIHLVLRPRAIDQCAANTHNYYMVVQNMYGGENISNAVGVRAFTRAIRVQPGNISAADFELIHQAFMSREQKNNETRAENLRYTGGAVLGLIGIPKNFENRLAAVPTNVAARGNDDPATAARARGKMVELIATVEEDIQYVDMAFMTHSGQCIAPRVPRDPALANMLASFRAFAANKASEILAARPVVTIVQPQKYGVLTEYLIQTLDDEIGEMDAEDHSNFMACLRGLPNQLPEPADVNFFVMQQLQKAINQPHTIIRALEGDQKEITAASKCALETVQSWISRHNVAAIAVAPQSVINNNNVQVQVNNSNLDRPAAAPVSAVRSGMFHHSLSDVLGAAVKECQKQLVGAKVGDSNITKIRDQLLAINELLRLLSDQAPKAAVALMMETYTNSADNTVLQLLGNVHRCAPLQAQDSSINSMRVQTGELLAILDLVVQNGMDVTSAIETQKVINEDSAEKLHFLNSLIPEEPMPRP